MQKKTFNHTKQRNLTIKNHVMNRIDEQTQK